jgi:hypothetical protein
MVTCSNDDCVATDSNGDCVIAHDADVGLPNETSSPCEDDAALSLPHLPDSDPTDAPATTATDLGEVHMSNTIPGNTRATRSSTAVRTNKKSDSDEVQHFTDE